MNPLERSLIEKAGYSNGWENTFSGENAVVVMTSARHKAEAHVQMSQGGSYHVGFPKGPAANELAITHPNREPGGNFIATNLAHLGTLLRRAAELAMSLPNHTAELFEQEIAKIESSPPSVTETLRLVKQRIGQDLFRQALMDYWEGACAVTGLNLGPVLRASHAKPWAKCESNLERLDVFNGFLLAPNLDVLFDQGYMTFGDDGVAMLSPKLTNDHQVHFGFGCEIQMKLRWISPQHLPYLQWHRSEIFVP